MKKKKIIMLSIEELRDEEIQKIVKVLQKLEGFQEYHWVVTNRKINTFSRKDLLNVLSKVTNEETIKRFSTCKEGLWTFPEKCPFCQKIIVVPLNQTRDSAFILHLKQCSVAFRELTKNGTLF